MGARTLVQRGSSGSNLYLFCHVDPSAVVASPVGGTIAVERWGEGTRSYRPLLDSYGGFDSWVEGVAREASVESFGRVALVTFSAGSQVAKDVCRGSSLPDAIVMLDGLYGDKPGGSSPGDGAVVLDEGLDAIAD